MNELEIFIAKLRNNKEFLRNRFEISTLGIFGSYVRGEQKEKSDVDILINIKEPISLFTMVDLKDYLSELIGKKVDLVLEEELKPRIKENVLKEVIYV